MHLVQLSCLTGLCVCLVQLSCLTGLCVCLVQLSCLTGLCVCLVQLSCLTGLCVCPVQLSCQNGLCVCPVQLCCLTGLWFSRHSKTTGLLCFPASDVVYTCGWTWRFSCAFCCCSVSADFRARPSLQCSVHGAVCIYRSVGRCGFRYGPVYLCTYIGPWVGVGSGVDLCTYVPV